MEDTQAPIGKNLAQHIADFKNKYPDYQNLYGLPVPGIDKDSRRFFDDFCCALEAFEKGKMSRFLDWADCFLDWEEHIKKASPQDYPYIAVLEKMKSVVDTKLDHFINIIDAVLKNGGQRKDGKEYDLLKVKEYLKGLVTFSDDNNLFTFGESVDFYTQYKILQGLCVISNKPTQPQIIQKLYTLRDQLKKSAEYKDNQKNLLDKVENQILLHDQSLRTKHAIDAFFQISAKGKKTTALKEDLYGERITADYFKGFIYGYGALMDGIGKVLDFVGLIPAAILFIPVSLVSLLVFPFYYGYKNNENKKAQAEADNVNIEPNNNETVESTPLVVQGALNQNIIKTAKEKSTASREHINDKAASKSVFQYSRKGPGFLAFFRPEVRSDGAVINAPQQERAAAVGLSL